MDSAVPRRAALLAGSRYELLVKVATGGTATVYVGRVLGSVGFNRLVAIKRAHPHLRDDPAARDALVREATLASRIHHVNVVAIEDVEETEDELLLVMSYIEGGALSELLDASDGPLPAPLGFRILLDACAGLSAVHALTDERGRELGMVHRDVSPQNILVGVDGTARLTDFGLARVTEVSASATATVKGKIAYMAPEYIEGAPPTQRCDVFSMGVVAWETLSGRRLFRGENDADTLRRVLSQGVPRIATATGLPEPLDGVLARALAKEPSARYATLRELDAALTDVAKLSEVATAAEVGALVRRLVGKVLARRRDTIRMLADPENATGSLLLDELPLGASAASRAAPPLRALAPTVPLDALEPTLPLAAHDLGAAPLDEPEAETLRTARAPASAREDEHMGAPPDVSPPAASRRGAWSRRTWVLVAVSLVALAIALGARLSATPEARREPLERQPAETKSLGLVLPRASPPASAASAATAPSVVPRTGAEPSPRAAPSPPTPAPTPLPTPPPLPAPELPKNPYKQRGATP